MQSIPNHFPALMSLFLASTLACSAAFAELYVSPVVRNSVTYNGAGEPSNAVESQGRSRAVAGASDVHGRFLMREQTERLTTVLRYGQNVPLFVAVEKIVPNASDWYINIDEGLPNSTVNWEGGDTWEEVLQVLADQNNISISVNREERAIGISKNSKLAVYLAMRVPQVWRLSTDKTLRENLDLWAKRAGWRLEWDEKRLDIDFPVNHSAVLVGDFIGEDGVISRLLASLKGSERPLRAEFYTANNVLLITEAGFQQEVRY